MCDKLVRDRVPEALTEKGIVFEASVLSDEAFGRVLLDKLLEEVREVADAAPDEQLQELADVQEVLDELARFYGLTPEQVRTAQARKREARGGFERRVLLHWFEEPK